MNKVLKKLYAVIGVLVMLLPIALGAMSGSVKADDTGKTETKDYSKAQVVITKFGFDSEKDKEAIKEFKGFDASKEDQTNNTNYKLLKGVDFVAYDVTAKYAALTPAQKQLLAEGNKNNDGKTDKDSDNNNFSTIVSGLYEGLTEVATATTDENGKAAFSELTLSEKKQVFVFHEVPDETGTYTPSRDILVTLTASMVGGDKGPLYIYAKNYSDASKAPSGFNLNFKKVDKDSNQPLQNAQFVLSKKIEGGKTVYAFLDANDAKNNIEWRELKKGETEENAVHFTSDENGKFTVNAKARSYTSFRSAKDESWKFGIGIGDEITVTETTAPDGYDKLAPFTITIKSNENPNQGYVNIKDIDKNEDKEDVTDYDLKSTDAFLIGNEAANLLPHTGGMGIVLFVVAGAALIALGTFAYKKQRA